MVAAYSLFALSILVYVLAAFLAARVLLRERSWAETTAEVLETNVESFVDGRSQRRFRPVYLLRYKALRDMREALIKSPVSSDTRAAAAERMARLPVGRRCLIHFDPHVPGQANPSLPSRRLSLARAFAVVLLGLAVDVAGATVWFAAQGAKW